MEDNVSALKDQEYYHKEDADYVMSWIVEYAQIPQVLNVKFANQTFLTNLLRQETNVFAKLHFYLMMLDNVLALLDRDMTLWEDANHAILLIVKLVDKQIIKHAANVSPTLEEVMMVLNVIALSVQVRLLI